MISRQLARAHPYAIELILMLSAAWTARCLFLRPASMQASFAAYYRLMGRLDDNERFWAGLAAVAATALLLGLASLPSHPLAAVSVALRIVGLAVAGFLFVVLGCSWLAGSTESIAAGLTLLLGLSAWAELIRSPNLPRAP